MRCPGPIQLEAFVDGELPAKVAVTVARHVAACPSCADRVEETHRLVALLRQVSVEELDEAEALRLVESVKRQAGRPRFRWPVTWRQSVAVAVVLLVLGAGALTYRAILPGQTLRPADPFAQVLLKEHQAYEAVLAADPDFNVQVAAARW